jgi:hypothetical protein
MIPEDELRAWVLVFYTEGTALRPDKYWPDWGRKQYGEFSKAMKVNGDIRKIAAEQAVGAGDEEKLRGIYGWVKKNVTNVNSAAARRRTTGAVSSPTGPAATP